MSINIDDYRNAPSGIGPLAAEWADKPHRLVYDLATELAVERMMRQGAETQSDRRRRVIAYWGKRLGYERYNDMVYPAKLDGEIAHDCAMEKKPPAIEKLEAELAAEREYRREADGKYAELWAERNGWQARAEKAEAENAALRQALEEWRGHFGCEGPFNAYIQDGNSDPRTRVAAKAQERANQATNENAALRERVRVLTEALEQWNDIGFDFWITEDEWAMREPDEDDGREWLNLSALTRAALAAAPEPPADAVAAKVREMAAAKGMTPQQFADAFNALTPATRKDDLQVREVQLAVASANEISGFRENKPAQIAGNPEPSASAGKGE